MKTTLFSVKDKIVVVTGGLGQLGRQYTRALLQQGAKVANFDLPSQEEQLTKWFPDLQQQDNLLFVPVDITRRDSLETGLDQVKSRWGVPHGLVNNAALDSPPNAPAEENGPFETYPEASWDNIMEVNVKGVFLCCQVIGGAMAIAGRGAIINICSIYGLVSPDQSLYDYRRQAGQTFFKPVAYAVSKSALLNLTRYLATYWSGRGIRVNTLTLAGVFNNQDPAFLKAYCAKVPLGRMADEAEYNGAVIFLLSEASAYMTGANLIIDGGWTAW
jgi:NAD(P)-dependent dehydrogenase (short-subunit alcohol dehydrogenase family)